MTQKEFFRLNRRIVAFGGKRKSREEAHMRGGSGPETTLRRSRQFACAKLNRRMKNDR